MEEMNICYGDCQERIGIPNGCRIIFDKTINPKIGDMVVCSDKYGSLRQQLKLLIGYSSDKAIVSTQYIDRTRDFTFETPEIYGVVLMCLDLESDDIVWRRNNVAPENGEESSQYELIKYRCLYQQKDNDMKKARQEIYYLKDNLFNMMSYSERVNNYKDSWCIVCQHHRICDKKRLPEDVGRPLKFSNCDYGRWQPRIKGCEDYASIFSKLQVFRSDKL